MLRALILAFALACAGAWAPAWAQQLAVPPLSGRVIDQTATLAADEVAELEAKLAAFEAEAGPQIVVLMVASTQGEDIGGFAQRVGEAWKIGRREVGDGLLIVVAKDDRRINIQTAKALEGAVPDLAARQIIDRAIRPAFRANDYAGGLNAAVDQLIARIRGENLPLPEQSRARPQADRGPQIEELLMFFFIAVPVIGSVMTRVMGRKLGARDHRRRGRWHRRLADGQRVAGRGRGAGGAGGRGPVRAGLGGTQHQPRWPGRWAAHHLRLRRRPWRLGRWRVSAAAGGGGFSSGGGGDFGGGGASGDW